MGFKVGDVVDLVGCPALRGGKITELLPSVEGVKVLFKTPRQTDFCEQCGSQFNLSRNGGTGEVVCMRTGCGHEHGFVEKTLVVSVDGLINVSERQRAEKIADFRKRLRSLLQKGVDDELITHEQCGDLYGIVLMITY